MNVAVLVSAVLGFVLSGYALAVRRKVTADPTHSPLCDISSSVSCSKAFASRYGVTLGIPNPIAGLVYFPLVLAISLIQPACLIYLAGPALMVTFYLAVVSYLIQRNFCLVCSAVYLVNLIIFFSVKPG